LLVPLNTFNREFELVLNGGMLELCQFEETEGSVSVVPFHW